MNLGQSTNDVYPTALKLGLDRAVVTLHGALVELSKGFTGKACEFADVVKIGRTQLQDAVPMTLGQEFQAFATALLTEARSLEDVRLGLHSLNIGGTAIGTGLNSCSEYRLQAISTLRALTGITTLHSAADLIESTQDTGALVQVSSALKRIAIKMSKICNDLRLLSSGPQAGLSEIVLPPRQAGSSMMPGKVNPVIPEVVNQVAFVVIGNDLTVTMAAGAGQLQINAFAPVIAKALFESLRYLTAGCLALGQLCVVDITANTDRLARVVESSAGLAAALNPVIGYAAASSLARDALVRGTSVAELAVERGLFTTSELDELLDPAGLVSPAASAGTPRVSSVGGAS